jgi:hypothetical protein
LIVSLRVARWLVAAGAAALLAAAAAGCSDSGSTQSKAAHQAKQSSVSPSAAPRSLLKVTMPTAGITTAQRPAADAVLTYWTRYGTAVSTGDLKGSELAGAVSTASGVASTQRVVDSLTKKKQRYQGSLLITVRAIDVGPQTATVDACVDQRNSLLTSDTGKTVAEPGKTAVLPIAHTLVLRDKHWLIDRLSPAAFHC